MAVFLPFCSNTQLPELKNQTGQKILNSATSLCYPYLKDAKVLSTHTKVAVSSTGISRLRRYVEVDSPSPGCVNMCFTTKATSAITSASVAVKIMLQHLVITGQISKDEAVSRAYQMSAASLDFPLKHMDSRQRVDFYNTQGNLMGHPYDSLRIHPCNGLQRDIQLPNMSRYSDEVLNKCRALDCNI